MEERLAMYCLILIMLFSLTIVSCNESPPVSGLQHQEKVDSVAKPVAGKSIPVKDTIPAYTSHIYSKYIPSSVTTMLNLQLPDWKLPSPDRWEKFWFQQYKKDSVLVDYIPADFNGDHKPDYAFILENAEKNFAVWVLQSQDTVYQAIKLHKINEVSLPVDMGLELVPKGELTYIDLDADDTKTIILNHQALQVLFFERAAVTYYWKNGKYASVTTGD